MRYIKYIAIFFAITFVSVGYFSFKKQLPDLVALPPENLSLIKDGAITTLLYDTSYINQGEGALELRPTSTAGTSTEGVTQYNVAQRIFQGLWHTDVQVGMFVWEEDHFHYHFNDYIELKLESIDGTLTQQIAKESFCIRDVDYAATHADARYSACTKDVQGTSPGWGDTYYSNYPGQGIDVSNLPQGTYRLTQTINPNSILQESDTSNNSASTLFKLESGKVTIISQTGSNLMVTHTHKNDLGTHENVEVVADHLDVPWDIAFLPNGGMLVPERGGKVVEITNGSKHEISVPGVTHTGEGGLLGLVLHPNFASNHFVYIYMTSGDSSNELNKVVRYVYKDGTLTENKVIIDNIPGAEYHDGGRLEFGPDKMLYITTGDATKPILAQDKNSLAGKILRLGDDGSVPSDNPFGNAVYSYGHRNPQGLAWDQEGRLWETEHGRSGVLSEIPYAGTGSGYDELNLIEKGKNYGWPFIQGDKTKEGMVTPKYHSGASSTWAPGGTAYANGSIYIGGLRGAALFEAKLNGTEVSEFVVHLKETYGRIRTVRVGPDGALYLTTSNQDGRGTPAADDDRILKITLSSLE